MNLPSAMPTDAPVIDEAEARRIDDAIQAKIEDRTRRAFIRQWVDRAGLYVGTDLRRLDTAAAAVALAWNPARTGLLLTGETGSGKTRLAWIMAGVCIIRQWRVVAYNGVQFGRAVSMYLADQDSAEEWLDTLVNADLFFLDDAWQSGMSDGETRTLFDILERRMNAKPSRPLLLTTQYTGREIVARMAKSGQPDGRAVAIFRRLRDTCTMVHCRKAAL